MLCLLRARWALTTRCLLPSPLPPAQVWAVRENLSELALGLPAARLSAVPFYSGTAALVLGAYGLSTLIPSIYVS